MKNLKDSISSQEPAASGQRRRNQSSGLRTGFTLVDPGSESGVTSLHKGFTLVELMIVVAVLGILAAMVIPEFSGHIQKAKESAAKDSLRLYREAVERFAADNNGISPGYQIDDLSQPPKALRLLIQLAQNQDYLSEMPQNPFNGLSNTYIIDSGQPLPNSAIDGYGWIYQPSTRTVKLNKDGVDSGGEAYLDY